MKNLDARLYIPWRAQIIFLLSPEVQYNFVLLILSGRQHFLFGESILDPSFCNPFTARSSNSRRKFDYTERLDIPSTSRSLSFCKHGHLGEETVSPICPGLVKTEAAKGEVSQSSEDVDERHLDTEKA